MAVWLLWGLLAAVLVFAVCVRLAPSDPARWHVAPAAEGPSGTVSAGEGWASLRLEAGDARALLARLDAIAIASPRTTRLAGSVEAGRITWITRSALWGFPDYTTAEARADGLYLYARLRFGRGDMGVNATRLRDWQAALTGG
ncbi:DUF1499 domain-containing protein [Tabrizicola sp.]|uniref:DUF1499 domain-containing protein n=1 Tax=Tabrizicola sp. TaxID=2005166 RepID=UPI0027376E34|nr:DUF1499 domain-containing protein [Tabrizicola sp.]MDP3196540.1 DUF1499 domain-containing protein [Tabrizicola sp.]MDZ4068231.1 DUF1499 domain-containing protein [Tabrizicola sp.]